jgi:hypothetical protein
MESKIFLLWGLDMISDNQKRFARQTKLLELLRQNRLEGKGAGVTSMKMDSGHGALGAGSPPTLALTLIDFD